MHSGYVDKMYSLLFCHGIIMSLRMEGDFVMKDTIIEKLKTVIPGDEDSYDQVYEYFDEVLLEENDWEVVQAAIIDILLMDGFAEEQYDLLATAIYNAMLMKEEVKKDPIIALVNYRLNTVDDPYNNNTAWSITAGLLGLDYANAEYNALKDDKNISILKELGVWN